MVILFAKRQRPGDEHVTLASQWKEKGNMVKDLFEKSLHSQKKKNEWRNPALALLPYLPSKFWEDKMFGYEASIRDHETLRKQEQRL